MEPQPLTEAEIMRRREFVASAIAALGLDIAAPLIDRAARLDWSPVESHADPDTTLAAHGEWFSTMTASRHLPLLVRDFAHLDTRSKVYLAAMTGESLSMLGHSRQAQEWFMWAGEHYRTSGQARWLHGRNGYIALDMDRPEFVRPGVDGQGHANHAKAQAKLGNREEATLALQRAGRHTTGEHAGIFAFADVEWHHAGSKVHTALGNTHAARDHQREALAVMPEDWTLARVMLNLDIAETYAREARRDDAAVHLHETMAVVPADHRYGLVTRRAGEVWDAIPA